MSHFTRLTRLDMSLTTLSLPGIALGVARRQSSAWFLLLAFASHKWVISACLGLKWARSAVSQTTDKLYVVFFEILEKERQKAVSGVLQVVFMSLGFIFMVLLGLAEVRSETEEQLVVAL